MKRNLHLLCALYGLHHLHIDSSNCFQSGYFSAEQPFTELILEAIKLVLKELRPQIINIIESVPLPDEISISAIGNSYGDIYETHLEWAKNSKLNKTKNGDTVIDGYLDYMVPIL